MNLKSNAFTRKGIKNRLNKRQLILKLLVFNQLKTRFIFGVFSLTVEVDDLEANYRRLVVKNISTIHHSFQVPLPAQLQRRAGASSNEQMEKTRHKKKRLTSSV
ncbi:MAG: hypothetical protein ACLRV7_07925 [Hoylesella buccalis]